MNKLILCSMFLISVSIFSIEYNIYNITAEHVFSASHKGKNSIKDLAVNNFPGSGSLSVGPGIFFDNNKLVISDQVNDKPRTIYLNEDYSFDEIYDKSFYNSKTIKYEDKIIGYEHDFLFIFNKNGWTQLSWLSADDGLFFVKGFKDIYYQDNTLFIYDKDYKLWAIKDPGLDIEKNKKNIIKEDEIINEINKGYYKDLSIDSSNRLFLNNYLQTNNINQFITYNRETRSIQTKPLVNFIDSEDLYIQGDAAYVGSDKDGNKYWYQGGALLIFNNEGWPIEDFIVDDWTKVDTYPAVSPAGDVFFMNYGEDRVTLYKVKRQW